ncbi:MAG: hypothetical protein IPM98_15290 [Lewinellaceae bacterium]|nr:hypothetical protein [Lewinellaceae bacterium]
MKHFIFLAIAVLTLAVTACNDTPKPATTTTDAATTPAEQTAVAYACPMKCEGEKNYEQPGTCPVCKMDLVSTSELEEEHDHPHDGHDHGHEH